MSKPSILYNRNGRPYKKAKLRDGKRQFIEYWAFDHSRDDLVKKRIYNLPDGKRRKRFIRDAISDINSKLKEGWELNPPQTTDPEIDGLSASMPLKRLFPALVKIKQEEWGPTTRNNYSSAIGVFMDWAERSGLAGLPVESVTRNHMRQFLSWLTTERQVRGRKKRGVGKTTRNNYLRMIHAVFQIAVEDQDLLEVNPCAKIKELPAPAQKHRWYTHQEQQRWEGATRHADPMLYKFTRLIYWGFLRPVEICRLQLWDIDLAQGVITVPADKAKSKHAGTVAITPGLGRILAEMELSQYPANYLLFGPGLKPGAGASQGNADQSRRKKWTDKHRASLERLDMYDGLLDLYSWKHTGNRRAWEAGHTDLLALQRQNRHKDVKTTLRYLRNLGLVQQLELRDAEW